MTESLSLQQRNGWLFVAMTTETAVLYYPIGVNYHTWRTRKIQLPQPLERVSDASFRLVQAPAVTVNLKDGVRTRAHYVEEVKATAPG